MGHRAPGLSVLSCKQGCPPRHLRQRLQSWLAYAHLEHESRRQVQASSPSVALHGTIHSCWEGLHHHSRKRALRIGDESAGPMAVWEKPLEGRGCVRVSCAKLPCPVLFQRTVPYTSMGEEHREAADRQKTDSTGQTDNREEKTGPGPCRLTEVASLAAVSPGSWAPPTTSEASAGCNIKRQQGIR